MDENARLTATHHPPKTVFLKTDFRKRVFGHNFGSLTRELGAHFLLLGENARPTATHHPPKTVFLKTDFRKRVSDPTFAV